MAMIREPSFREMEERVEVERIVIYPPEIGLPESVSARELRDGILRLFAENRRFLQLTRSLEDPAEVRWRRRQRELLESSRGQPVAQDAITPRPGETAQASIMRRFKVYVAESAMARIQPLSVSEWLLHDRVLNPEIHLKADAEREARFARPVFKDSAAALLLSERTAEIRRGDPKLSEAQAVQIAYRKDPGLFNRVTEARRAAQ